MSSNKPKKNIKVVNGNGDNLEISPVLNHIPISKPKIDKKDESKIVIPQEKKNK